MKVKIAIVLLVISAGTYLFLPTFMESSLDDPNFENPLAGEMGSLKTQVENVEQRIDDTISSVQSEITTLATDKSDITESPTDIEAKEPSFFEQIFGGILAKPDIVETAPNVGQETKEEKSVADTKVEETPKPPTLTPINKSNNNAEPLFQTLSLSTAKADDGTISLNYVDTSGGTQSVSVTLRNSEKTLFSGEFFSSKFETQVEDPSSTPHFIDMVVVHEEYGTIASSVFNPAGQTDTMINGVFTES